MEPEKSGKVDQEAPQSSNSQHDRRNILAGASIDLMSEWFSCEVPTWYVTRTKLPAEIRSEFDAKLASAVKGGKIDCGKIDEAGRWLLDHADVDPNLRLSQLFQEMLFNERPTPAEIAARIPHHRIEATTELAGRYLVIARCRMMNSMILGQHSKTMASRIEADAREYRAAVESLMNLQKSELEVRKLQSELAEAEAIAKEFPKII